MGYDLTEVKELLEPEQVYELLEYFEAEPQMYDTYIICRTICHEGHTHKLYYYYGSKLFKCYTGSCGVFDIFELVQKIQDLDLNDAVFFIVHYFNLQYEVGLTDVDATFEDWRLFKRRQKYQELERKNANDNKVILPEIPNYIEHYPQPHIVPWEKGGISKEIMDYMGIRYNPTNGSILIPHKDIDGRLIGIRQRTLVKEEEDWWGKYRPAYLQGKLCNHPLAFNLYGLNIAKEGIQAMETAIVCEGEKSVLLYQTYFGTKNCICVASCGSSFSNYQFHLLLALGVKEIVIAYDRDYHNRRDVSALETKEKVQKICKKFSGYCNMSYLFDEKRILGYKDSPLDCGKEAFLELWRNRFYIT